MRAKEFITEHNEKLISFDKMSNYEYYRFAMHMGGGEEIERGMDAYSNYVAYTKEDEDKIRHAAKKAGKKVRKTVEIDTEPNGTPTVSPVAKIKKNKHGV